MQKQTKLFWIATMITIGWIILMRPYTPKNIVAFELAKTIPAAEQILNDWGAAGIEKAAASIYLDFVFIILYCTSIMLGCRVSAQYAGIKKLIGMAAFFAMAIWLAGLLDVVENLCMLKTLSAPTISTTTIAFYAAAIKFTIVALSLVFILASGLTGLIKKKTGY
jgi:hypothetical protein